jgi:hypothetical protein
MADLSVVALDNTLYVTTPGRAKESRASQGKVAGARERAKKSRR